MMTTRTDTFSMLLLALLGLALVGAGCSNSDGADAPAPGSEQLDNRRSVRVETFVLSPVGFEDVVSLNGTVEALNDATLSAQASGTVVALAPLGRVVGAGQTVAQLDPGTAQAGIRQAEAQVAAAQAGLDLAEDNLKRQRPLYQDSIISAIEFENVRARYSQALAQLHQAQAGLAQAAELVKNTRVTTPFTGTVEERLVEPGEQVTPGRPIIRLVNTSRVKVTAGVPERYAGDIRPGTPVQIHLKAYGGQTVRGRVSFVGSAIDPNSRTFPVEIELANPEGLLKPQMVTNVLLPRERFENALVVPLSAVLRDEQGTAVYVVDRTDGPPVAVRRPVTLGARSGGDVVVTSGLQAGDEIIVLGQNNVTRGDALEIVEQHRRLEEAPLAEPVD